MAYDPTVLTVRERILLNIEESLTAIKGAPTYYHKVAKVRRFLGNTLEFPNYPAIAIVPGQDKADDSRLGLIEYRLPVTLLLMVKSQRWPADLSRLIADVRVAMTTDWTRGGLALTTCGTVEEIYDSEPSAPLGGAQLEYEVLYRTLYHDPGSAI